MIETKEFSVGGYQYKITQFGAKKGQSLLLVCAKIIGGSVGEVAATNSGDVALGKALQRIFDGLSEATFAKTCEDFAEVCYFSEDGEKWIKLSSQYNDHFAGRYKELLQWLEGCFQANFGSFLEELKGAVGVPAKKNPTEPPSQSH